MPPNILHVHQPPKLQLSIAVTLVYTADGTPPVADDSWYVHASAQATTDHVDAVGGEGTGLIETYDFELPGRVDARRTGAVYAELPAKRRPAQLACRNRHETRAIALRALPTAVWPRRIREEETR